MSKEREGLCNLILDSKAGKLLISLQRKLKFTGVCLSE